MTSPTRIAALRYAMIATGIIFIGGLYTLSRVWPSGWSWGMGYSHHWPMVLGVYGTLGACLIVASRDPLDNRSLVWFTVWSSVVHALVMAGEVVTDPAEVGHLVGAGVAARRRCTRHPDPPSHGEDSGHRPRRSPRGLRRTHPGWDPAASPLGLGPGEAGRHRLQQQRRALGSMYGVRTKWTTLSSVLLNKRLFSHPPARSEVVPPLLMPLCLAQSRRAAAIAAA